MVDMLLDRKFNDGNSLFTAKNKNSQYRINSESKTNKKGTQFPESLIITLSGQQDVELHPQMLYNPDIANALFRGGYIESWGCGTIKIIYECIQLGISQLKYYCDMSGFWIEFR